MNSRYYSNNAPNNAAPSQRGRNASLTGYAITILFLQNRSLKESSNGFPIANVANTNNNGIRNEPLQKYKLNPPVERKPLSSGLGIPDFFPLLPLSNAVIGSYGPENVPEDTINESSISSGFSEPILFDVSTFRFLGWQVTNNNKGRNGINKK